MSKVKCIGIIAEDISDFETAVILVKRILNKKNLSFKKRIGHGCGKIRHNALDYANDLQRKGCDMLIFIHDLDRNTYKTLFDELTVKIKTSSIDKKFICIPIEELETWFLSDSETLKTLFNLQRAPKFNGMPETIRSPKEKLGHQIFICSNKKTLFLNTTHNQKIAEKIEIDLVKERCPSFKLLHTFVTSHQYK